MAFRNVIPKTVLVIAVLISLSGCSTYQNVTGYFNTYYNSQKLFNEAVDEMERNPPRDRDTNYFASPIISKTVDEKLDKVIEKCSRLLQSYSQSGWVDNALLMIGKSYVYKDESESALRKFSELLQNYPESDLRFEARLWSAKAEYYSSRFAEAQKIITELVPDAENEGEDDVAIEALMLAGQMHIEDGDYRQAIENYKKAVEISGDDKLRALAQYQLGLCHERLDDHENAATAYALVLRHDPSPDLKFRARLHHGIQASAAAHYDEALNVLERLLEEDLRTDDRGLVDMEIATTYGAMGDTARAFELHTMVDTTFQRTDASAKSLYRRGLLYETQFNDLQKAHEYYNRAKGEFPASEITPIAKRKTDNLAHYFRLQSDIVKYDSLYFIALHPEAARARIDSSITPKDSTGLIHSDSTSPKRDEKAIVAQDEEHRLQSKLPEESVSPPPAVSDTSEDAIGDEEQPFARGRRANERRIAESDDVPKGLDTLARSNLRARRDSVVNRLTRQVSTTYTPDTLRYLSAQSRFELAGLFLLELNSPDSAKLWYESVYRDSLPTRFVPRALYALSEIHRSKGDTVAMDSVYKVLLTEYAQTEYAAQVKRILGMEVTPAQKDLTEVKYNDAMLALQAGKTKESMDILRRIVSDNAVSPYAAKAQYTIGWIYENVERNLDSAASSYKRLLEKYPSTIYAENAKPKVAVKDDPKSLSQYIRINEIQAIGKVAAVDRRQGGTSAQHGNKNAEENIRRGRGKDAGNDEDEENVDEEEDTEPPDTSDEGGD